MADDSNFHRQVGRLAVVIVFLLNHLPLLVTAFIAGVLCAVLSVVMVLIMPFWEGVCVSAALTLAVCLVVHFIFIALESDDLPSAPPPDDYF